MKIKVLSPEEFEASKVISGEEFEYLADWRSQDTVYSFVFVCLRCEARVTVQYCPNCNAWLNGGGRSHGEGEPLNCGKCGWSTRSWECPRCKCVNQVLKTAYALCSKKKCFIATAACGTDSSREVISLRQFRDTRMTGTFGRECIRAYEMFSPPLARFIAGSEVRRTLVLRLFVRPLSLLAENSRKTGNRAR